jgi:ribonuclease HII
MEDLHKYEHELNDEGIEYIAGIDEVGRGPLVGPVVCACVVLPKDYDLLGLTDSKKLSPKKRDLFYDIIKENALGIGIGVISEKRIDEVNIYQATKEGMIMAFNEVNCKVEHVLIDAMKLDLDVPSTSIIKGDSKSISIAAASVIAKVTRDRMMDELDLKYPMYGFKRHKGYPTKEHLKAIDEYGIINDHRMSYKPVMDAAAKGEFYENTNKDINSGVFTN